MTVDAIRLYLLAGLLIHKAVWELLKKNQAVIKKSVPLTVKMVKAVKVCILLAIIAQALLPEVLPMTNGSGALQTTGLVLFTIGLAIAILGRVQLGNNWLDIETAAVKQNQAVVSKGVYSYVRHPIYVGDLILLIGFELALNSWLVMAALVLVPVVLRQAVREERVLLKQLPDYNRYCQRTKRFIPFVA
jgi:protein-S-isoprenylcysteine O-methyltransferase Ste14